MSNEIITTPLFKNISTLIESARSNAARYVNSSFRMVQIAKFFPDEQIVSTLSALLSWSHFVELIGLDDNY